MSEDAIERDNYIGVSEEIAPKRFSIRGVYPKTKIATERDFGEVPPWYFQSDEAKVERISSAIRNVIPTLETRYAAKGDPSTK